MSHRSTLTLRHATPTRNLESILDSGLDPSKATGARPLVWLHPPSASKWAIAHVAERHSVPLPAVSLVTIQIPRAWLVRRYLPRVKKWVWTCNRFIPAAQCVVSVNPFTHVA